MSAKMAADTFITVLYNYNDSYHGYGYGCKILSRLGRCSSLFFFLFLALHIDVLSSRCDEDIEAQHCIELGAGIAAVCCFFFSPSVKQKSRGVLYFFSSLHRCMDHGDPCPDNQSRPLTGGTN